MLDVEAGRSLFELINSLWLALIALIAVILLIRRRR